MDVRSNVGFAKHMSQQHAAGPSFRVFESHGSDRQEWLSLFESWPQWEVFAHPDYLALYEEPGCIGVCAVYTCPDGRVIYPLMVRDLATAGFPRRDGEQLYDTTSPPYGYGGPFIDGNGDKDVLAAGFFREYELWANSQNVISEYLMFSPKGEPETYYPGEVAVKMPTVLRSLDLSPVEVFSDYKKTLQRHVKGAMRAGVTVEIDLTGERTPEFLAIYDETMKRRSAAKSYYLDAHFLERLNSNLSGYFAYFYALLDGKTVSAELVLISADSTFFFRGGSLEYALHAKPNHLLKHHIILWSMEHGKRSYLLGGGNDAEDPLYRYKLGFAPRGSRPLMVGKRIFRQDQYNQLIADRRSYEQGRGVDWVPKTGYFPAYRAPSER